MSPNPDTVRLTKESTIEEKTAKGFVISVDGLQSEDVDHGA
jgi:hypothetical protein